MAEPLLSMHGALGLVPSLREQREGRGEEGKRGWEKRGRFESNTECDNTCLSPQIFRRLRQRIA